MRTLATFESASFNQSEPRDYFINPECYGDDTCRWLMTRLQAVGVATDAEPDQEDFGWFFRFTVPEGEHCCVVGYRSGADGRPGQWLVWIERERGFVVSIFWGRKRGISSSATTVLHMALSAPEIRNLRWHERSDFDSGNEAGAAEP